MSDVQRNLAKTLGRSTSPLGTVRASRHAGLPTVAKNSTAVPTPAHTIVIVDDSRSVLQQAASVLTKAGFRVVTVDSPFAAATVLAREMPDLVLMDVHMPALSGDKIVSLMRKRDHLQDLKVALFSSDDPLTLAQLARECGAEGVVHKGETLENLVAQVRALLLHQPGTLH